MAEDAQSQPIIIKKKRKSSHRGAHHGGAWKVAYADFVTAMMAFFLLLWLISATSQEQKQGIADYFSPTVASTSTNSGAGQILGGRTLSAEGASVSESAPLGVPAPSPGPSPSAKGEATGESEGGLEGEAFQVLAEAEEEAFAKTEELLRQAIQETPELHDLASNLIIERTPEGLRIQIVDQDRRAIFASGSAEMTPEIRRLLETVTQAITSLPNRVAVTGHTDAAPFRGAGGYTNWELSADRANASRRTMVAAGLAEGRISTVEGRADRELIEADDPLSPRNRRISILLLREPAAYAETQEGADSAGNPLAAQAATPPGSADPAPAETETTAPSDAVPQFDPGAAGSLGPIQIYREDE